ncbi:cytochrome P450 [Aspergillus minisclerotigenes]|uniref:Cytochrome P450 n=1 Tax=Aspergillus minisclerotigenes TaxID=656917 RepID=A0A5N6J032_9EURO|nr:cytochrome P450 [Aspergillus minisclerotigenes]
MDIVFKLNYFRSPLKSFPGPFSAKLSNLWRLQDVCKGRCDITHNELHRRYGSAVCIGPNVLSLSDPALINQVYSTRDPWVKVSSERTQDPQHSDMYNVNDSVVSGVRIKNLFSHQDEQWHAKYIRPVKNHYSMTRVQELEPGVDITINLFLEKLRERFVSTGNTCDMSEYTNYFTWDTMSQLSYSQSIGMLEAGNDRFGILEVSNRSLDYFASPKTLISSFVQVCQIPMLDLLLDKNPICRLGPPSFGWAVNVSAEQYQKRLTEGKQSHNGIKDFLDRYIEAKSKMPDIVDDNVAQMYLVLNIVAGSDTTASAISAAVYYEELRGANLSTPPQWKEIRSLPYLDAVMREAMRVHPGVGLLLERIVPKGGFTLPDGRFVPEGTIVGMNPWVINRNRTVFGPEPDSFKPERWLPAEGENDEAYQTRFSKMKGTDLTFGAGPRACLGRCISQLESYRFVATLFTTFDLEHPNHEWEVTNSWFVRQRNIPVVIKERKS